MDTKIKVGVIGVGALGRHHARLYNENDKCTVVGVFDVDFEQCKKVAEEFDLTPFEKMEELAEKCEALSIAVPATLHHDISAPLLEMGRHLLIEKPLESDLAKGRKIAELAAKNNLVVGVGHVERFNPAMDYLESRKAENIFIEAHRLANYPPPRPGMHRRGTEVGVVLDLMIHDIDLILSMVSSPITSIDAVGIPVLSATEDIASVRIHFENGAVANLTASRVSVDPLRRFRVFQSDCYISMDYGKCSGMILKKNRIGIKEKKVDLDEKNALAHEIDDFVDAVTKTIETGVLHKTKVPVEDGLKALEVAIQITENLTMHNEKHGFTFK
ncbi:Gfo/Idh/MocA family oxidoreductase [Lentisphaerota bacterium WC36G]|nr:Gfo/Idh/MocA family oxidoreductase [Lentisphaerae bacterium WC36]